MTDARDLGLQAMFDEAGKVNTDDEFVARVMADIDGLRRRTVIGWAGTGLLLVSIAWWLAGPLMSLVGFASQLLPDSLVTVEDQWLAQLLAPVNSVAGAVGLAFLGAWFFYRKIFAS